MVMEKAGEGGGGGGGAATDWRAALPDELRAEPMFKDVPDVPTLAKIARDLTAYKGASIRIPGPDAGDAVRQEFTAKLREKVPELVLRSDVEALRAAIGVPKDAKEYAVDGVTFEPGTELAEPEVASLRERAARYGLPKEQFKQLLSDVASERAQAAKQAKEAQAALKQEWGAAYDERLGKVRAVLDQIGAPQPLKEAVAKGLIDKATAAMFFNLATSLGAQPREVATQDRGGTVTMAPGEAQARIAEIMRREEFNHPGKDPDGFKRLHAEWVRLQPLAYPDLAAAAARES
jgi:hypothetical protein